MPRGKEKKKRKEASIDWVPPIRSAAFFRRLEFKGGGRLEKKKGEGEGDKNSPQPDR